VTLQQNGAQPLYIFRVTDTSDRERWYCSQLNWLECRWRAGLYVVRM